MDRRKLLRTLMAGAVATCPACLGAARALASGDAPTGDSHGGDPGALPHWLYEGNAGPEHWGELSPAFQVCGLGLQQSPVNLQGPVTAQMGGIAIDYRSTSLNAVNNGHTIQVNCDPGSRVVIDGESYDLLQFHFHHPSEHLFNGRAYPMEAHFVHASAAGVLAVLGVFIETGDNNRLLAPIWDAMPGAEGQEARSASVTFSPADLLPPDQRFYRYMGSLTTPPCSEIVIWSVFRQPVQASSRQIDQFAALFPMNARPVQDLHRRMLLLGSASTGTQ